MKTLVVLRGVLLCCDACVLGWERTPYACWLLRVRGKNALFEPLFGGRQRRGLQASFLVGCVIIAGGAGQKIAADKLRVLLPTRAGCAFADFWGSLWRELVCVPPSAPPALNYFLFFPFPLIHTSRHERGHAFDSLIEALSCLL